MTSSRIALIAGVGSAIGWTLKSIAIGTAGGLDRSPFEGPLFFLGLGCYLVAVVALGVAATRGRPAWLRATSGVVALALGIVLTSAIGAVINAVQAPSPLRHWAWTEVNLWVIALGTLALVLAVRARDASRA